MLRLHKVLHDVPDLMAELWEFFGEEPIPIEELEASVKPKGSKAQEEEDKSSQVRPSGVRSCRWGRNLKLILMAEAQARTSDPPDTPSRNPLRREL